MYAINEDRININGQAVDTFVREIAEGPVRLAVSAGTNAYKGSNNRTYVGIDCAAGDGHFNLIRDEAGRVTGVEMAGCGREWLFAILKALAFAFHALDDQRRSVKD